MKKKMTARQLQLRPMQTHQKVNPFANRCATEFVSHSSRSIYRIFHMFSPYQPLPTRTSSLCVVASHRTTSSFKGKQKNWFFIRLLHIYPTTSCVNSIILSRALIYCDGAFARTTFKANDIFVWLQN